MHPRVDHCVEQVMRQYPGESPRALARYYEAVHQELAPLARRLEAEASALRAALDNVQHLAAKHRREEWAQHMLRFCADAGVVGSPLRGRSGR